jgi:hypothetical protein
MQYVAQGAELGRYEHRAVMVRPILHYLVRRAGHVDIGELRS